MQMRGLIRECMSFVGCIILSVTLNCIHYIHQHGPMLKSSCSSNLRTAMEHQHRKVDEQFQFKESKFTSKRRWQGASQATREIIPLLSSRVT